MAHPPPLMLFGRFVDQDMLMRYRSGGIGNKYMREIESRYKKMSLDVIIGTNVLGAETKITTWMLMPRAVKANAKMLPSQVTHHVVREGTKVLKPPVEVKLWMPSMRTNLMTESMCLLK